MRGERHGMLNKEVAEAVQGIVRHVSILQWILGIAISAFIGMMFGFAGLMLKFFRDFKADAVTKITAHKDETKETTREIKRKVEMLDVCREENAGNIIRLQEDIKAVVRICKERHGK